MGDKFEVYFPAINHKKIVTLKNLILKQITITQASDVTLPMLPNYSSQNTNSMAAITNAIPTVPEAQSLAHAPFSPPSEQRQGHSCRLRTWPHSVHLLISQRLFFLQEKSRPAPHTASSDSHYQSVPITLDDIAEATDSQQINLFDESFDNSSFTHVITQPYVHVTVSPVCPASLWNHLAV